MSIVEPPSSIVIGPYTYQVEFERSHNGAANSWGHIRYEESVIRVDDTLKDDRRRVCLMHEALHGVFEVTGNNPDNEEALVTAFAPVMVDMMRRNPALVAYLMDGIEQ